MLELKVEPTNPHDQFATVVIKLDGTVVGHIPKHASKAVLLSLSKAGSAGLCEVSLVHNNYVDGPALRR